MNLLWSSFGLCFLRSHQREIFAWNLNEKTKPQLNYLQLRLMDDALCAHIHVINKHIVIFFCCNLCFVREIHSKKSRCLHGFIDGLFVHVQPQGMCGEIPFWLTIDKQEQYEKRERERSKNEKKKKIVRIHLNNRYW